MSVWFRKAFQANVSKMFYNAAVLSYKDSI